MLKTGIETIAIPYLKNQFPLTTGPE